MLSIMLADVGSWLGTVLIPGLIIFIAIAFIITTRVMASRYKKIPPNQVAIVYGRKYRAPDGQTQGFKVIMGGGVLVLPIVESVQFMSTAAFQTSIDENDIPNKDNVKISVKGVATCKISNTPEDLHNAAEAFLGKSDQSIEQFVRNILIGHLRSIIGKLDIDEILRKRDTFNRQVVDESTEELKRLGIQVITLVIQEVNDGHGYIDALGRKTVAEAIRDADIKVAQAQAETRMQVSTALKEAAIVEAKNVVATAEAEKNRDVQRAVFKVSADTELAKANQALAIATAAQEKTLRVAQAERDAAERDAQITVQLKEAARRAQELIATVVKPAEAQKQAVIIKAEADRQAAILQAEAQQQVAIKQAQGKAEASKLEGEGEASKTKAVLIAQAEGEAAKTRQALLAEAEGQAAMKGKVLEAEADGTKKLAEALAKMTTDAKLILVLDRLPVLFDRGGDAMSKVATSIFSSVAAPLGQIDEVRVFDFGGGNGVNRFGSIVPETVFNFLAAAKSRGIDFKPILEKLGININELTSMLGQKPDNGNNIENLTAIRDHKIEQAKSARAKDEELS